MVVNYICRCLYSWQCYLCPQQHHKWTKLVRIVTKAYNRNWLKNSSCTSVFGPHFNDPLTHCSNTNIPCNILTEMHTAIKMKWKYNESQRKHSRIPFAMYFPLIVLSTLHYGSFIILLIQLLFKYTTVVLVLFSQVIFLEIVISGCQTKISVLWKSTDILKKICQ